jgi:hypothetical protein
MLHTQPISVAVPFQALALTRLIGGIDGSNSTESIAFHFLCLLRVVNVAVSATRLSLVQKNLTGCVCLTLCDLET